MKKSPLTKAIAATAVFAAAIAGGVAADAAAVAADQSAAKAGAAGKITKFGYSANVFGTKVVVNGVELRTLKDAKAQQRCTRVLRGETVKGSALGTDNLLPIGNDLIRISPSTSRTLTYRSGQTYGVRGINTIADIRVGGEVAGIKTPVLKIEGLQSIADAFNTKGRFGHRESFGFGGISLEIPEDGPVPAEVQDLLDIIQSALPINQVVNQVIDLLETVGVIEIPGLGSLALGRTTGTAGRNSASSNAYALKIEVINPTDESKTIVQLGRAASRISQPVPSGVFRSTMSALDLGIGELLEFGGISPQAIDCEGTNGKVRTKTIGAASVPGLINLNGIKYSWMGKQLPRGKAKGFTQTAIGKVEIPAVDLVINGLLSRVDMRSVGVNQKVQRTVSSKLASITVGGRPLAISPGQTKSFDGGIVRYLVQQNSNFYGTEVRALKITLFEENVTLTLGQTAGRIFFK